MGFHNPVGRSPTFVTDGYHDLDNDPCADVTFKSSDGILFNLQRKYLEVATGAFPGAEFDTNGEVTPLTEPAAVLAILFGFVHPKRFPDVEDLAFSSLAEVAEAAEKYEAFAAIELCRLQMRFASFFEERVGYLWLTAGITGPFFQSTHWKF